jgi:flagellar biosynthesis chaperone FliJ
MPFQFSLATVLRLRENLEHTELLTLEKRYSELALAQGRLWEAEQNIIRAAESRQLELSRGTTAIQLQLAIEEESQMRRQRDARLQKLQEAQEVLREQLAIYWKARQKRDILQELRKQKFDVYQRTQAKLEQRERDELFLLRRKRVR